MQLSEQTQIEASIGFTAGILVGALASWVFIMFFTPWEWYFKLFSSIGEVGIVGSLLLTLRAQIQQRRNYIETQAEMKKITEASEKIIKERVTNNK